jgi:Rad3-related DNA helicase
MKWTETAKNESFVNVIAKYKSRRGADTARLEIVALDPSKITEPIFSEVYSNIVMSGTLQPLEAYIRITKLPKNTVKKIVPSPFPKEHVLPLICCDVTTAMEERTAQMYYTIIEHTKEVIYNTPGNTRVFAASFQVLEALRANGLMRSRKNRYSASTEAGAPRKTREWLMSLKRVLNMAELHSWEF